MYPMVFISVELILMKARVLARKTKYKEAPLQRMSQSNLKLCPFDMNVTSTVC